VREQRGWETEGERTEGTGEQWGEGTERKREQKGEEKRER
jgi:hypothetical protein